MTKDEIMALDYEALEKRSQEVAEATGTADAETLESLSAELDAIEERKAQLDAEIEERKKDAAAVAAGAGKVLEEAKENIMTEKEARSSKKYIDAYVDYLKGKNDGTECRALLTELADIADSSGPVPVPTYVETKIQTAWENDEIMSRVSKSALKGILKVGVEMEATGAVFHEEGDDPVTEETLKLAIVELTPQTLKKWISFSTEVMDLNGQAFIDYVYDEIEYQIVKSASRAALAKIDAAPTTGSTAPKVSEASVAAIGLTDIIDAIGTLSGDARNLVFIANRGTIAAYQALAMNANYAVDVFGGATPIPTDVLASFANTYANQFFGYVGDLSAIRANYPNGDEVKFVFDEYSLAEADLVKVVGRQYVALGLIRNNAFCRLKKVE